MLCFTSCYYYCNHYCRCYWKHVIPILVPNAVTSSFYHCYLSLSLSISLSLSLSLSQGIANALYGLQRMGSHAHGAVSLLNVLSDQLLRSREIFDGQAISNSLYGLKAMSTDSPEVRAILAALVQTIKRGSSKQTVGKYGTRDTNDKSPSSFLQMTSKGIGGSFIGGLD
jgi:hypothetical protein